MGEWTVQKVDDYTAETKGLCGIYFAQIIVVIPHIPYLLYGHKDKSNERIGVNNMKIKQRLTAIVLICSLMVLIFFWGGAEPNYSIC